MRGMAWHGMAWNHPFCSARQQTSVWTKEDVEKVKWNRKMMNDDFNLE